jgi:SAM-dependent methyltransferase
MGIGHLYSNQYRGLRYARNYEDSFFQRPEVTIEGRVLNVGSGGDRREKYELYSDEISEYISVDISDDEAVDVRADGRSLPFSDESVDTVILSEVLEHVPVVDASGLIAEVYRVLRPGGSTLITTPFYFPLHGMPNDHVRYTVFGLEQPCESAGFEKVMTIPAGGFTDAFLLLLGEPFYYITTRIPLPEALFIPVHYLVKALGVGVNTLLGFLGGNPQSKYYYIHDYAVATK